MLHQAWLYADAGWTVHGIPATVALAVVTVLAYLVGRWARPPVDATLVQARRELKRARAIAREIDQIADSVRDSLVSHRGNLERFRRRLESIAAGRSNQPWNELCKEAEDLLRPTLKLASQIAGAYDELRQQTSALMSFTEVRTDPLTGVSNRRALDEMLDMMAAMRHRYGQAVSVVLFDLDFFKKINDEEGHLSGDAVLRDFARLLDDSARDTDFVGRYGGEEFVVVMPHTDLPGAAEFAERFRQIVVGTRIGLRPLTVSSGVAMLAAHETPRDVLARADAALYHAKSSGRNRVHIHEAGDPRPWELPALPAASQVVTQLVAAPHEACPVG